MEHVEPGSKIVVDDTYANGDSYRGDAIVVLRPAARYTEDHSEENPTLSHTRRAILKHGYGTYTFANGATFVGEWDLGQMHGRCVFQEVLAVAPSREALPGDRYEGLWRHGERVHGIYRFVGGDLYVGGFSRNMKHGAGVVWENMCAYEVHYDHDVLLRKVPMAPRYNSEAAVLSSLSPPSSVEAVVPSRRHHKVPTTRRNADVSRNDPYHGCHRRCQGSATCVTDDAVGAALSELQRRKLDLWNKQPLGRTLPKDKGVWKPCDTSDPRNPRSGRHDFLLDTSSELRHHFRYHFT